MASRSGPPSRDEPADLACDPAWLEQNVEQAAGILRSHAWRGVEAQHVVSTMRLVDSLAEQELLEQILERNKPPLPRSTTAKHFLLATPFRYRPGHDSRFRRAGHRGQWYGAEKLRTACAEVAYWRWRFLVDSAGLAGETLLTQHTFFRARINGQAIDLTRPPWVTSRALWTHGSDYACTQALALAAAARHVLWIRYESVRDPGGVCAAVMDVEALELDVADLAAQQTWQCKTTRQAVQLVHGQDRFEWFF